MVYEKGQRIHIPGKDLPEWVTVYACLDTPAGHTIFVETAEGVYTPIELTPDEFAKIEVLDNDGGAPSARVLAGMWSQWMAAAGANADTTVLASTPLRPYEPPRRVRRVDSLEGSLSWHDPRSTPRSCVSAQCGW